MKLPARISDVRGISMVEVLVALLVFVLGVVALSTSGMVAGEQMRAGRSDAHLWAAVHQQFDVIRAQGYDNLTAGADTVHGFPMSWDIQGADPKKIILTATVMSRRGVAVPDTFVTYLHDWGKSP